jgi:hypothetical protein
VFLCPEEEGGPGASSEDTDSEQELSPIKTRVMLRWVNQWQAVGKGLGALIDNQPTWRQTPSRSSLADTVVSKTAACNVSFLDIVENV